MATRKRRAATGSVEEYADEAIRLSKSFVYHLWAHDHEWCLNRVSKDFLWIGADREQYVRSQDGFAAMLDQLGAVDGRYSISDEEYSAVVADERICGVAGHFMVLAPPNDEQITAQSFRCTLVWRRTGKRPLLTHLHISAPKDHNDQGESYPIQAGTDAYRYMKSLMRLGSSRKAVSLYDVDGTVHWVHPSQIIYLEANRKRTIVHCMTKDIVVPAVIRDAVEMVDSKVMRVHRSYAVNRDHVVELKAGRLLLDDGTAIAIPAKRIADVRAGLTER